MTLLQYRKEEGRRTNENGGNNRKGSKQTDAGVNEKKKKLKPAFPSLFAVGDPTGNNRGTCLPGICPVRPAE